MDTWIIRSVCYVCIDLLQAQLLTDSVNVALWDSYLARWISLDHRFDSIAFVVGSADDAHIMTFVVRDDVFVLESSKLFQLGVSYSAVLRDIFGIKSEFDVETERTLAEFHAARTSLLDGTATDRALVDDLAQKLAARGDELSSIVGFELRQIERRLKRTAG